MSQGELAAAAYAVVFVVVLVYLVIIAAKLGRLQRETAELLELAGRKRDYAAPVLGEATAREVAER